MAYDCPLSCVQHIARKWKFGVATPEIEARVPQFLQEQARSCVTVPRQIARQMLNETALQLAAPGKGILASDESTGTIGKRLERAGLQNDEVLWQPPNSAPGTEAPKLASLTSCAPVTDHEARLPRAFLYGSRHWYLHFRRHPVQGNAVPERVEREALCGVSTGPRHPAWHQG